MKKVSLFFAALAVSAMTMAANYQLVSSTSDLVAGKKYIIGSAAQDSAKFISTESNANNRKSSEKIAVVGKKVAATDNVLVLTLGGNATDGWTFLTENYLGTAGYLNATNTTSSNFLKVVSTLDEFANFSISFTADNDAVITCTGKTSRNLMRYNSSSSLFACYSSGQDPVYLYVEAKAGGDDIQVEDVKFSNKLDTIQVSEARKLKYSISPDTATDQRVSFQSLNEDALTVTENGVITGVAENASVAVVITALDSLNKGNKLTDTCYVTVVPMPLVLVENIAFNQDSVSVKVGKTLKLKYTIAPDNATDQRVSFQSLNEDALTVTEDGTITGVTENASVAVVITAEDSLNTGEKLTDTCYVEVKTIPVPTTQQYLKLTSAPADWSGEYILVYEATNDSACVFSGVDAASNFVPAEINKKSITGAFITLTLAKMEGGYSVMVNGGENDGKYLAGSGSGNKLNFNQTATLNTIEMGENGVVITSGRVLQYNTSKTDNRFRYYSAGGQRAVQLYKLKKQTSQPVPVTEIVADNATDTVMMNETLELKYTIAPDSATDQRVEFVIVSGGEYITLTDGVVTGVAVGDAQVSVTALDSLNKGDKLVATYNIHVKECVFNTCADVNAAKSGDVLKLNPVTVSYVNGANVYVQDASGSTLMYMYDSGLKAGDVVSGIKGTAAPYNGLPELKPTNKVADWTITAGVAPTFPDATTAPAADQVNKIFTYKGVTELNGSFVEGTRSDLTGKFLSEDFNLYSNFKQAATFDKEKIYDIVGAVGVINNTDVRVFFISATDVTPSRINEVAEKTAVKKMMVNGQMVIVRDGKMFNALGAEL